MKNFVQIAIVAIILIFAASCGNNEVVVEKPKPKPTCHVELVYTPLTSSVIAVEYRVQKGQKPDEIVQMHKTNPNMVGGAFLDYTMDMFLADNPEVATSTKRAIRKDKCDPTKIDTVWYKAWNLEENNLVYLRVPARLDTVPGNGWNAQWFIPEKTSPIKHLVDRIEIASSNLEKKPVADLRENPCENEGGLVSPPNDGGSRGDSWSTVPPTGGDDGSSSDLSDWLPWTIIVLLILTGFIVLYLQNRNQHNSTRSHVSAESNETRAFTESQHGQTHDVIVNDGQETRGRVAESMKDLGSKLSQVIADEGKADREMLERQLDAERKSQKETLATFMRAVSQNGGLSGKKKE